MQYLKLYEIRHMCIPLIMCKTDSSLSFIIFMNMSLEFRPDVKHVLLWNVEFSELIYALIHVLMIMYPITYSFNYLFYMKFCY
jgi:hypothetical protein